MSEVAVAGLTADDLLQIRDIVSIWNIAEDEGDAERWTDLFAEDGSSRYGNGRIEQGRAVLLDAARRRAVDPRMFSWSHWTLGEPVIDPTPDGAIMRHYYTTLNEAEPGDWRFWSVTERVYRVRRIDGAWRIVERTIHNLPLGLAAEEDLARARSGEHTVGEHEEDEMVDGRLSAADRLAIQDLITRYSVSEDTGDAEETAALFTEDGVVVNSRGESTVGRAAILEAARRRWENPSQRTRVHWAANILIDGSGDEADVQSYHMILATEGGVRIDGVVSKRDRVRRIDGRWYFVERRVEPIGRKASA